jgi:16S rRNA (cytosine967-C5)-methyltransferase
MINARKAVLNSLIKFEEDNSYSNLALDKTLKSEDFSAKDKAFITTLFYGVIERKITLDYIIKRFSENNGRLKKYVRQNLRMALYQILFLDKIPNSAAVDESIKLLNGKYSFAKGYTNALLRNVIRNLPLDMDFKEIDDDIKRLSVKYSFPEDLIKFFIKNYGEDVELLLSAFSKIPKTAIRVNTLKTDDDSLIEILKDEGIIATKGNIKNSLFIENIGSLEKLKSFKEGLFHIEDESAQQAAVFLDAKSGDDVLDICAAPGGKTFTIAQIMQNKGKIVANDVYPHKLKLIEKGAERLGIDIIETSLKDASKDTGFAKFDKILCDVPCSGLGIIRKKPEIRYKNPHSLDNLPNLQYLILCNASHFLKSGGKLIYSTCTLNKLENEEVVARFLKDNKDFSKLKEKTYFPHIDGNDGFYISVLEKAK